MQNTFSQSGNDSKWFSKKSFLRIGMWNSRPHLLHLKYHLKLFDYLNTRLIVPQVRLFRSAVENSNLLEVDFVSTRVMAAFLSVSPFILAFLTYGACISFGYLCL